MDTVWVTYAPLIWLAIAVLFAILEAATVQIVSIWFATGAVAAAFAALLGASSGLQLAVFGVTSALVMLCARPFLKNVLQPKRVKTNADSLIGMLGKVTERIDNISSQGRVFVAGLSWAARSADGDIIEPGEDVLIREIAGVKLIVERVV